LIIAWNPVGERHLVLLFDLEPGKKIEIVLRTPGT